MGRSRARAIERVVVNSQAPFNLNSCLFVAIERCGWDYHDVQTIALDDPNVGFFLRVRRGT